VSRKWDEDSFAAAAFANYLERKPRLYAVTGWVNSPEQRRINSYERHSYDPNRRLYEAVVFCRKRISELADAIDGDKQKAAKFLYSLVAYLENNVKVVSLVVPNEANAYTVFETLNYRGLDLSVLDLIRGC